MGRVLWSPTMVDRRQSGSTPILAADSGLSSRRQHWVGRG